MKSSVFFKRYLCTDKDGDTVFQSKPARFSVPTAFAGSMNTALQYLLRTQGFSAGTNGFTRSKKP